jgi:hypothetical protein
VDVQVDDPIANVLSLNLKRRHLNQSQLGMISDRVRCIDGRFGTVGPPHWWAPGQPRPQFPLRDVSLPRTAPWLRRWQIWTMRQSRLKCYAF